MSECLAFSSIDPTPPSQEAEKKYPVGLSIIGMVIVSAISWWAIFKGIGAAAGVISKLFA